ncbi:MAG: alanine--tRNA ligase [Gaiellaceae bacterium]
MRTTAELREEYLSFFESKGHLRRPSSSLIPRADDRSTLFTSAGMQPQMPFFLGRDKPPAPMTTTSQKCFRTSDIDAVGLDTYHLTFFEMLGNFSFGQYFKEGAIAYATEFLRERLKLDWDRLWVSVHAGDPELKLGPDEEAIELWQRVGMPAERIVPLPSSENFWSVGGPGPCGPDSEIYWDWGEETGCGEPDCLPGCTRCERFLEFWNLVFMAYELHADGTLTPLPEQNIDTGLGLERTARIVQNVASVYDTDAYQRMMAWIAGQSGTNYGDSPDATKSHRVLADHGRGMAFMVAEGVTPSNEGRGYVLRRIVRRAVQHGLRIGMRGSFLAGLTDAVTEEMGEPYPELVEHRREVHRVLTAEEERFRETLERGMKVFEEAAQRGGDISGEDAFTLQATYGFPIELTVELARERGAGVNDEEFTRLMEQHREISRAGTAGGQAARAAEFAAAAGFRSDFVGWEKTEVLTQLGALEPLEDRRFLAKLRESPFYAEGGGQVTDAGFIELDGPHGPPPDPARAELEAAYRLDEDQVLVFRGEGFSAGDRVRAVVPWSVRFPTMANHTATHLLHKALQEVLGERARQAGSAVRPDKLRFDFTHGEALTTEERAEVERRVNEKVWESRPVRAYVTTLEEARNLGAIMLFGEKYGDEVRVVEVGGYSRELCGGTHVRSTAEVGPFVILSEGSVGAGARRIEAVTGGDAYALLVARAREAEVLRDELGRARKETKKQAAAPRAGPDIVEERRNRAGDVEVIVAEVKAASGDDLLELSDRLKQQHAPAAVVLGSREDGSAQLVLNFDRSLEGRGLDARRVIKEAAAVIGGGGGGRPTMARAGGKQPERLSDALARAEELIVAALS